MIRGLRNLVVLGKYGRIPQNIFRRTFTSQEDIIVPSPYQTLTIPDQTLDQYVWDSVSKWSTKTAMVRNKYFEKNLYNEIT